jgi:hypothetical protein
MKPGEGEESNAPRGTWRNKIDISLAMICFGSELVAHAVRGQSAGGDARTGSFYFT